MTHKLFPGGVLRSFGGSNSCLNGVKLPLLPGVELVHEGNISLNIRIAYGH
jgi:hypothetical protein